MPGRTSIARIVAALAILGGSVAVATPSHAGAPSTWIGCGKTSDWGDSANWDNGVPGNGGSAVINAPFTDCNSTEIGAAHITNIPAISLASLSITSVAGYTGGIVYLDNGGPLTVTQSFHWSGGSIAIPIDLPAGSSGVIDGAGRTSALSGPLTVGGTLTLDNTGDASGAGVELSNADAITVQPGATLASDGSSYVYGTACCVAPRDQLVNQGTVHVTDGTLQLDGIEFDDSSTVDVASGADLLNTIGPVNFGDGTVLGGAGTLTLGTGTTATLLGTTDIEPGSTLALNTTLSSGDLGGTGTLTGGGTITWGSGKLGSSGNTITIAHGTSLVASGLVTGNPTRTLTGPIDNHGSMTFTDQATVFAISGSSITNESDGIFSFAPGSEFDSSACCAANPNDPITNLGTFEVPAAPAGVATGTPAVLNGISYVENAATTSVAKGEVLTLGGSARAPNTVTGGTIDGGGTVQVTGPTAVSGTLALAGSSTLRLDRYGTLDGTATVAGAGSMLWTGGSVSGADLVLAPDGGLTLNGADHKVIANIGGGSTASLVEIKTDTAIQAGTSSAHDVFDLGYSTVHNHGTMTVANDVDLFGGKLVNEGTLSIDPGVGGAVLADPNDHIVNTGKVEIASGTLTDEGGYTESGGTTDIASGATLSSGGYSGGTVTVTGGTLGGDGTVAAPVDNSGGIVAPGATGAAGATGVLTITGNYTQGAGGRLAADVAGATAGSGFDQLTVSGTATIDGTLQVTARGFTPPASSSYDVLSAAGGVTGTFGCIVSGGLSSGQWGASYGADDVLVSVEASGNDQCASAAAPTGLSGSPQDGQVALTWTAPAGTGALPITGYEVEDSTNGGTSWSAPIPTGSTAASYTVTGLTNGVTYLFRVAADTANGTGVYSTPSAPVTPTSGVTPPPPPPPPPPVTPTPTPTPTPTSPSPTPTSPSPTPTSPSPTPTTPTPTPTPTSPTPTPTPTSTSGHPPVLRSVHASKHYVRIGHHAPRLDFTHRPHGGTVLHFKVDQASTVALRFFRVVHGDKKLAGVLRLGVGSGPHRLYFDGVLPRRHHHHRLHHLHAGKYRVKLSAVHHGHRSNVEGLSLHLHQ